MVALNSDDQRTLFLKLSQVPRSESVWASIALAALSAWPIPPPMSRYHFSLDASGVGPAAFQSCSSAALVPLLSPRDTKGASNSTGIARQRKGRCDADMSTKSRGDPATEAGSLRVAAYVLRLGVGFAFEVRLSGGGHNSTLLVTGCNGLGRDVGMSAGQEAGIAGGGPAIGPRPGAPIYRRETREPRSAPPLASGPMAQVHVEPTFK